MLTVEVKINGRLVARATAQNTTNLADVSDYAVRVAENKSEVAGEGVLREGTITGHNRRQSAWALVEKIAALATQEKKHGG